MFDQSIQLFCQTRGRQIFLNNQTSRASALKSFGVFALMIVSRKRKRNKDRRLSSGGDFGRRRRPRSANQHIGALKLAGDIVNKSSHVGVGESGFRVGPLDFLELPLAGLM